jgi:hypothetical protein
MNDASMRVQLAKTHERGATASPPAFYLVVVQYVF